MNQALYLLWIMGGNPSGEQGGGNPLLSFLPFILIIVVIYFLMIRPQKKRQQEREKLISGVAKGDRIITIGGIHGHVQSTKDKTLIVKIADNVKIEIERSAVSTVVRGNESGTGDAKLLEPETTN